VDASNRAARLAVECRGAEMPTRGHPQRIAERNRSLT
jgi:hypothetical protein